MATGTGKTAVTFQIAWKLFQSRCNLKRDGARRPRILFLADRNILADQAFNAFSAFNKDALVRNNPLHPSLRLHELHGKFRGIWSISISGNYRIIFERMDNGDIMFVSIGKHDIYKSL